MARPATREHTLRQIITYLVSGGAFFFSSYAWFYVADQLLRWSLSFASVSASLVGLLINFLLQHYWVFGTHKSSKHTAGFTAKYILITLIDLAIDYLIIRALKEVGITPYLGRFISAGFFVFWNYFWYKYWVFADETVASPKLATR